MTNAAVAVADYLAANVPGLTLGTNLFNGPMPPGELLASAETVSCIATGGGMPLSYCSPGTGEAKQLAYPTVQILIRGKTYASTRTLAHAIYGAINRANISGYLDCLCMQAEPLYIEEEEAVLYYWSVNVELWVEE